LSTISAVLSVVEEALPALPKNPLLRAEEGAFNAAAGMAGVSPSLAETE
jgi:hypothetical protein